MTPPPDGAGVVTWREVERFDKALSEERQNRREADNKLDEDKADAKDVARLAEEFKSLRATLQWFMGIMALAVTTVAAIVVQVANH